MKMSHISLFSFIAVAFSSLLIYQNCSQQGFSTVAFTKASGTITGMDTDGVIEGQVVVPNCDNDTVQCPDQLPVEIETHDGGEIGETTATNPDVNPQNPGSMTYTFTYDVPDSYMCQVIVVIVTMPDGAKVQLQFNDRTPQWGGSSSCGFNITPLVTVDEVKQDGNIIYINGQCVSVPEGVDATGNIMGVQNNIKCVGGNFRLCAILDQPTTNSNVDIQQTANGQTSTVISTPFSTQNPGMNIITVEQVIKHGLDVTVKGKCTPGSRLKFTIYGALQGEMTCPDGGEFTFPGVKLVNTTPRILFVEMQTPFGPPITIQVDVDQTTAPNCSITTTVNNNFCVDSSGSITGQCQTGLPVLVYVDDTLQGVAYCKNESFTLDNVVLNNNMGTTQSTVRIEQPCGNPTAVCKDEKSMSHF